MTTPIEDIIHDAYHALCDYDVWTGKAYNYQYLQKYYEPLTAFLQEQSDLLRKQTGRNNNLNPHNVRRIFEQTKKEAEKIQNDPNKYFYNEDDSRTFRRLDNQFFQQFTYSLYEASEYLGMDMDWSPFVEIAGGDKTNYYMFYTGNGIYPMNNPHTIADFAKEHLPRCQSLSYQEIKDKHLYFGMESPSYQAFYNGDTYVLFDDIEKLPEDMKQDAKNHCPFYKQQKTSRPLPCDGKFQSGSENETNLSL